HHLLNNNNENVCDMIRRCSTTWDKNDGLPMVDYSSQKPGASRGSHAESIDINDFMSFIQQTEAYDFDIMLEIKDKENSAKKAVEIIEKKGFL
ncbi:MAG: UV DNA damage repair endonuclease UvsE, partial [Candidatus Omnitrophota bacterium]